MVVTRISPWPRVTLVFMKAMSRRSPSGTSCLVDRIDVLLDRDALAGEGALLDLQRRGDDHPAVGRDAVAGIDQHDVAGHDLVGRDLRHLTVPPHLGDRLHHLAEGRCRRLGLPLLVVAEPGVEERQQGEAHEGAPLADHRLTTAATTSTSCM